MNRERFNAWLHEVDKHMMRIAGVTHDDIADCLWADWFQDGVDPLEAAKDALTDDGFPGDLL